MPLALFKHNLNKCGQTITLQNRAIISPLFGSPDFDEGFTGDNEVTAIIKTQRGATLFDGVATDRPITHKISILYIAGISAETWILLSDGRRIDIIDVENCCEKNEILIFLCTETGVGEAAKK